MFHQTSERQPANRLPARAEKIRRENSEREAIGAGRLYCLSFVRARREPFRRLSGHLQFE